MIIDSENENSTLVTEFLVEYTTSSRTVLFVDKPIGNVSIDVIFENNQVYQCFYSTHPYPVKNMSLVLGTSTYDIFTGRKGVYLKH